MTHAEAREKLLDLAYGELSPREARRVERHAGECGECRAEVARIRETRRLVSALPPEPAPERGERVLLAAAREAAERMRERRRAPLLTRWAWATSIGALAVLAVAGVSYRLLEMRPPPREDADALVGPATPAPSRVEQEARKAAPSEAPDVVEVPPPARPPRQEPRAKVEAPERFAGAEEPARAPASAPAPRAGIGVAEERADRAPARAQARDEASDVRGEAPLAAAGAPSERSERRTSAAPEAEAPPPAAAPPPAPTGRAAAASRAPSRESSGAPPDPVAEYERLRREGRLRTTTHTYPRCAGEPVRAVDRDAEGRLLRLAAVGGSRGTVEQFYAPDGSLAAVRFERDGTRRLVRLGPGGAIPAGADLPPLVPGAAAGDPEDAPPRCE